MDENRLLVVFLDGGNRTAGDTEGVLDAVGEIVSGLQVAVVSGPGPPSERQRHPPGDTYLHGRARGFLVVAGDMVDGAWLWVPSLRALPWWDSTAPFLVVTRTDPAAALAALAHEYIDNVVLVSPTRGDVAVFAVQHAHAECSRVRVGRVERVATWRGARWDADDAALSALVSRKWTPRVEGCRIRAAVGSGTWSLASLVIEASTRGLQAQVTKTQVPVNGNVRLVDGRWQGVFGLLQSHDADVGLLMLPTVERFQVSGVGSGWSTALATCRTPRLTALIQALSALGDAGQRRRGRDPALLVGRRYG